MAKKVQVSLINAGFGRQENNHFSVRRFGAFLPDRNLAIVAGNVPV
jgi:hypothetical protein